MKIPKPSAVPQDLWDMLTESEKSKLAPEDGVFRVMILDDPFCPNYFTTWDKNGNAIATYNRNSNGWTLDEKY